MNRKLLFSILLSTLCLMVLSQGCTSPNCEDYVEAMGTCRDKMVATYGSPLKVEGKDRSMTTVTCKPETQRKDCGAGNFCIKAPGSAFAVCHKPGALYKRYQTLMDELSISCVPIFAKRQAGNKSYYSCVKAANCDLRKITGCGKLLQKEKTSGGSAYFIGFILFLGITILLEGLVLFGVLKVSDRMNPKVTITRALLLSVIVGVVGYPAIHASPLVGMAISSSLLFGLVNIFFYQGAGMPTLFTGIHILWVSLFFNFMVANANLGNEAWLYESKLMRIQLMEQHRKLDNLFEEYDRTQKEIAASRARAKKEAEEKKKEEARKKALEEQKKKEKEKDDK